MRKYLILLIISLSIGLTQNWTIELVDSTDLTFDCSIATDTQNYPNIAYCTRRRLGGNFYSYLLKYVRWNGSAWEFQPVETTEALNVGIPVFKVVKLCLDKQNHPHIAYVKDSCQFKYAHFDGDSWQILLIDSVSDLRDYHIKRKCIDITLSEDDIPHISYSFINFEDSTRGIKYAYKSGRSWIIQTVWEENRIPQYSLLLTLAININQFGHPVIAFENYYPAPIDSGYLFCARFNGQNWKIDTIERHWYSNYYVYSLKTDIYNRIHIYYQRLIELFYAVKSNDTWRIEFVATNGWGECGGEMILDEESPNVVYSSIRDPLTYAWKRDTMWHFEIIDPHYPGFYPSLAKDNEGGLHASYTRFDDNCLLYARRTPNAIEEKVVSLKTEISSVVYPNPAKSVMRVRVPWNYSKPKAQSSMLKIFDVSGIMIKEIAVPSARNDQAVEIPLKGIKPGIYFLRLGTQTKKFLVVK
ncbi:MAG: T9SS type A sorting domain-containing protein [candidate division WOR-3 bacterium]